MNTPATSYSLELTPCYEKAYYERCHDLPATPAKLWPFTMVQPRPGIWPGTEKAQGLLEGGQTYGLKVSQADQAPGRPILSTLLDQHRQGHLLRTLSVTCPPDGRVQDELGWMRPSGNETVKVTETKICQLCLRSPVSRNKCRPRPALKLLSKK